MNIWRRKDVQELLKALLTLDGEDEAKAFLRDLLTESELIEFSKRWKAARMLYRGRSYTSIVKETGLSSATVARISKWLHDGEGGYQLMLERIDRA